jgi:fructose-1,6-bisphosphatase
MDARNQQFVEMLVRHLMSFREDWRLYIKTEIQDETQKEFHMFSIRALGAMISAFRRWLTRMEEQKVKNVEN